MAQRVLMRRPAIILLAIGGVIALLLSSCGRGEATPTRAPASTSATVTPLPASAVPAATPTRPPPSPTATPVPTATQAPAAAARPTRGGTVNLRSANGWPVRDVYDTRGQFATNVLLPMMSQLITTNSYNDKTGEELIGDLAKSWEISADGTVFRFRLLEGVQWHDGMPFTSQDVAYSFNRAINPPAPTVTVHRAAFAGVKSIETPDANTVVITLKAPKVSFFRYLAVDSMLIYPEHIRDMVEFNKVNMGTGAFKFKSGDANTEAAMVRNERYFKRDASGEALPYLDAVTIFFITDGSTAFAAFRTGQYQIATGRDNDWLQEQQARLPEIIPNLQTQLIPGGSGFNLFLNSKTPALADKRVRQAIHLALDRYLLRDLWQKGLGSPLSAGMLPLELGGKWALPKEEMLSMAPYNPSKQAANRARARELLREAGYTAPLKLKMIGSVIAFDFRGMEIASSESLRDGGFDVSLQGIGTGERATTLAGGNFELAWQSTAQGFDDPAAVLVAIVRSDGAQNYGKWSYPKIDQLLDDADRTFDETKRLAIMYDLQREILNELPFVPVYWSGGGSMVARQEVKNLPKCWTSLAPCYTWDRIWLSKS